MDDVRLEALLFRPPPDVPADPRPMPGPDTGDAAGEPAITKPRQGNYFPPFLEPRKTSEKALVALIQEAWFGDVSTRRVDDLVQAMGLAGISKSTVSTLCADIDDRVNAFLERPLVGDWPYLRLDATYLRKREGGQIGTVPFQLTLTGEQRRDLLQMIDDLDGRDSLLMTSQVPTGRWHEIIGDSTLGRDPRLQAG